MNLIIDWSLDNPTQEGFVQLITKIIEWLPEASLIQAVTDDLNDRLTQLLVSPIVPEILGRLQSIETTLSNAEGNGAKLLPLIKKAVKIAASLLADD